MRRLGTLAAAAATIVVAYAAARATLPHGLPLGVVVIGLAFGLLNALGAVALILVYRTGGYVNFAQASFGAFGASLTFELTTGYGWSWYVAVALGLIAAIALSVLAEILFIQRLFSAPRLILTVATIGIAQVAATAELLLGKLKNVAGVTPNLNPPFSIGFKIGLISFDSADILIFIVAPIALAALGIFLSRSRYGAVAQAAAENSDRARLLGVSVRSLSTVTWALVGALSGIVAILETPLIGSAVGDANSGPTLLLRALAPAMLVGLGSLPLAVCAALLLGVVEETVSFSINQAGPVDLILFLVILVALLFRRRGQSRTTEGEERSFGLASIVRPVPQALARLWPVKLAGGAIALVAVIAAVAFPFALDLAGQSLATAVVCYALAAISLTVLTGYGGQISFGQWAFVGFGAMFGAALVANHHVPFLLGLVLAPLAGAMVAVLVGLPALRIRGIFLAVTTLAFAVAANSYIFNWHFFSAAYLPRTTVAGVNLANQRTYYYFCLAVLVICMLGVRNIRRTVLGRELFAVRDNDRAAASYGIGLIRSRLWSFAISGFLASLAGYLYLFNIGSVNSETFPPLTSLLLFSAVVIGGLGSQVGAVIGTIYFKGIQYFLPEWAQFLATSFGLLLILMFVPGGLSSIVFGARDALLRRYAQARGIRVGGIATLRREQLEGGAVAIEAAAASGDEAPEAS